MKTHVSPQKRTCNPSGSVHVRAALFYPYGPLRSPYDLSRLSFSGRRRRHRRVGRTLASPSTCAPPPPSSVPTAAGPAAIPVVTNWVRFGGPTTDRLPPPTRRRGSLSGSNSEPGGGGGHHLVWCGADCAWCLCCWLLFFVHLV